MNNNCPNNINPTILFNMNRRKYYLNIIEQNKTKPLSPKYPYNYFSTAYNRIYTPNQSIIPN